MREQLIVYAHNFKLLAARRSVNDVGHDVEYIGRVLSLSAREFGFNASSIRTKIYDILDQLSGQTFFSFMSMFLKILDFLRLKFQPLQEKEPKENQSQNSITNLSKLLCKCSCTHFGKTPKPKIRERRYNGSPQAY